MRKVVVEMGGEEVYKIRCLACGGTGVLESGSECGTCDGSGRLSESELAKLFDATARRAWDDGYSRGMAAADAALAPAVEWAKKTSYAQGYEDGLSAVTGELR
jgi:hypothetical protein